MLVAALPKLAGKTQAEVMADVIEAIRNGGMMADREAGMRLREEFRQQYSHR